MKKSLIWLFLVFLPLTVPADGLSAFSDGLLALDAAGFARQCESALEDTSLAGSVAAQRDGVPVIAWDEHYAFAVMRRTDGLLMLCHFTPAGDGLLLEWHNDLLISHYQELSLAMQGAVWSGGNLPTLQMNDNWTFTISLFQHDGTRLSLTADLSRDGWRVEEMSLDVRQPDGRWRPSLCLPGDCLADDIYLATCKPDDWRRGETEEEVMYGW